MSEAPEKHTTQYSVTYGKERILFSLEFRRRKTLAISVHPNLAVSVVAPTGKTLQTVKERVLKRASWIVKQKTYFQQFLPRQPERRYISGETHRYLGRQYQLKIRVGAKESVMLKDGSIWITAKEKRRSSALLSAWYRRQASKLFGESIRRCFKAFPPHSIQEPALRLKIMPNRWGGCTSSKTIILNPKLAKASKACIDYVVTHELCHLKYHNHGREYQRLLRKVMPDWKKLKQKLEALDG